MSYGILSMFSVLLSIFLALPLPVKAALVLGGFLTFGWSSTSSVEVQRMPQPMEVLPEFDEPIPAPEPPAAPPADEE